MNSLWHMTTQAPLRPSLSGQKAAEVAVIGGGMAGILTAALLRQEGVDVVVLEAAAVGSGQTGGTTAKITSQHGAIYHRLERQLGQNSAKLYAQANEWALEQYRQVVSRRNISCQWEETCAYLYSTEEDALLHQEATAQGRAGLPAYFTTDTELPFPVKGAVRCDGQAMFHPLLFLYDLAKDLTVYGGATVLEVEGDTIRTTGGTLQAKEIVFTCHYPFINTPGYYFLRMHQERSYVLALTNTPKLTGMYYSMDQTGLSLRPAGEFLLLGGGSHRTGENRSGGRYDALSQSAAHLFPGSSEYTRWSAQDCITLDGIPFIGRFSSATPHWWVATGFGKWGMTSSMVAAAIIRDGILGVSPAPWAALFSPQRFTLSASAARLLEEGKHAVGGLSREIFMPPRTIAASLPVGHGGVVEVDGKKVGLYKTPDGTAYAVDIRCPHLGCQLEWNPDEKSWDCPCHGSRFDYKGQIICGPAQNALSMTQFTPETFETFSTEI